MRRTFIASVVGVALLVSGPTLLLAAKRSTQKKEKPPKTETVDLTGTIQSMATDGPGFIASAKKNGKKEQPKTWRVVAGDNMKLSVAGSATLDYLKPGQILRFSAVLDQTTEKDKVIDTVKGEVKEITIISKEDHKLGIGDETKKEASKDAAAADPIPDAGSQKLKIVGKIQKVDAANNHKLTVTAGSHTLDITLASDPSINFEFTGSQILKDEPKIISHIASAKVVIHGFAMESGKTNLVKSEKLDVTLVEPLSGKKKPLTATLKTPVGKLEGDLSAPAAATTDSDSAAKPDDAKPDDTKPEDSKPEDTKPADKKPDDK